jgi:hypothetical protein
MTSDEIQLKIKNDPDFIYSKRFEYSLQKLLERYPDGAPTKVIAQVLCVTEEEIEEITQRAIIEIRTKMKVEI